MTTPEPQHSRHRPSGFDLTPEQATANHGGSFERFLLNATKEEKEVVFREAARLANEDQAKLFNQAQDNMRSAFNPTYMSSTSPTAPEAQPIKHNAGCWDCGGKGWFMLVDGVTKIDCIEYNHCKEHPWKHDSLSAARGLVYGFGMVVGAVLIALVVWVIE